MNQFISAQSLDIYAWYKDPDEEPDAQTNLSDQQDPPVPTMIVGTRSGDVLEITLRCFFNAPQRSDESFEEEPDEISRFECDEELKLRGNHAVQCLEEKYDGKSHFSQRRLIISVNPKNSLMATIGADKHLCLWETSNSRLVSKDELTKVPTCVKWNPNGDNLFVGFSNGSLVIYNVQINGQNNGPATHEKVGMEIILEIKDAETKTPVLNIEFSTDGEYMAVSYDNKKVGLGSIDHKRGR